MKRGALIFISIALLTLTGCSKIMDSETTGIYVDKKGVITEAIIEPFDKEYYDKDELKQTIEESIEEYNEEKGDGTIKLKKFQVKKDTTRIFLKYATYMDYKEFNRLVLYAGELSLATEQGYELKGTVTDAEGKNSTDISELAKSEEAYKVIIVKQPMQVETPSDILFKSDNVTVTDTCIAQVAKKAAKKEDVISTNLSAYAYIVYK